MRGKTIFTALSIMAITGASQAGAQMGRGMMEPGERMGRMQERGERGCDPGYGMGYGMHGEGHMHGGCFSFMGILDSLDLTADQSEKLKKMRSQFRKEQIRLGAAINVARIEYGDLMGEEKVDLKAVEKKVKEITGLKGELMMNAARASAEMRQVLTSEQRLKARTLLKERPQDCPLAGGPSRGDD